MKAMVYDRYGSPDVLNLLDIDVPVPADDEVLVRVHAAGLNPYDWHFLRGLPYPMRLMTGMRKPKRATILGSDMAGRVEAVGDSVTQFRPGDDVFAEVGSGVCAEFVCVAEAKLALKPSSVSYEDAAAFAYEVPLKSQLAKIPKHIEPVEQKSRDEKSAANVLAACMAKRCT